MRKLIDFHASDIRHVFNVDVYETHKGQSPFEKECRAYRIMANFDKLMSPLQSLIDENTYTTNEEPCISQKQLQNSA